MRKYTQKELKNLVSCGMAKNINNISHAEATKLYYECEKIGYSCGIYGINGGLLEDKEGNWYAITARNATLDTIF